MSKKVNIAVIKGVEGFCLAINDYRVCGPKPWGGGSVVHEFEVDLHHILKALPDAKEVQDE